MAQSDDLEHDLKPDDLIEDNDQDEEGAAGDEEVGDDDAGGEPVDIVAFAGEEPDSDPVDGQDAPQWVRDLRAQQRELTKRNRELEAKLQAAQGASSFAEAPQLGPKPTFESCDFDADKLASSLDEWHEQRRKVEAHKQQIEAQQSAELQRWQQRAQGYQAQRQALKVADFDAAEEAVANALSPAQQQVLLLTDQPAALVYALGRSKTKLAELAAKQDPLELALAIGELKGKLTVTTTKKPKTAPESPVRGSAAATGGADSEIMRLRAEAERTGDMTNVVRHMRHQRRAGK